MHSRNGFLDPLLCKSCVQNTIKCLGIETHCSDEGPITATVVQLLPGATAGITGIRHELRATEI